MSAHERYLIVPDVPGWAYDRKADAIIRHMPDVRWEKRYLAQYREMLLAPQPHRGYRRVLLLGYAYFEGPHPAPDSTARVVGTMTSHELIRDGRTRLARAAAASMRRVGCVSPGLLRHLASWGIDGVYCPNGVDHEVFRPLEAPERRRFTVGWVGSQRPDDMKGHGRILGPVMATCGDFDFRVLHVDSLRGEELLSSERMVEFYNGIDVFLATGELEGTPNPAFEAAACGKSVVATDTGAIAEFLRAPGCGVLVPCYHRRDPRATVAAVVDRLRELAADRHACARMGRAARARIVADWTWAQRVRPYYELLHS